MIPIVSRRGEHFGERKQYSKYDYEIASRCDALCSEVEDRAVHSNHAEPEALWAARRLGGASASREGRPRLIPTLSMCYPGIAPPPAPPPPRAPAPRAAVCPVRFTTDYAIRATAMRARADTRTRDGRCTHGYTHTGVPDNNITDHS